MEAPGHQNTSIGPGPSLQATNDTLEEDNGVIVETLAGYNNSYRVTNSGSWEDIRTLFDSDSETDSDMEDIIETEAKDEILKQTSEIQSTFQDHSVDLSVDNAKAEFNSSGSLFGASDSLIGGQCDDNVDHGDFNKLIDTTEEFIDVVCDGEAPLVQ